MPQQKQTTYNAMKISNLLAMCEKHDSLLEVELTTGSKHIITPHVVRSTNYVVSDKGTVAFSTIVGHREIKNKADSLRQDAADQLEQTGEFTAYNLDYGINNLRHYEIDPSTGFLKFLAPVSKVGQLTYIDEKTGKPYQETVTAETLIDSIPSLKGKPITSNHPLTKLDRNNATMFTKGSTHNMAFFSNDWLWASGSLFDGKLIEEVLNGDKRQISMGYEALIRKDGDRLVQAKREYNHLAACSRGRAGNQIGFKVDQSSDSPIMTLRMDMSDREINRLSPPNEMLDFLRVNGKRIY